MGASLCAPLRPTACDGDTQVGQSPNDSEPPRLRRMPRSGKCRYSQMPSALVSRVVGNPANASVVAPPADGEEACRLLGAREHWCQAVSQARRKEKPLWPRRQRHTETNDEQWMHQAQAAMELRVRWSSGRLRSMQVQRQSAVRRKYADTYRTAPPDQRCFSYTDPCMWYRMPECSVSQHIRHSIRVRLKTEQVSQSREKDRNQTAEVHVFDKVRLQNAKGK